MPDRTIVLLGETASGKSSTGNTVLGKKVFSANASSSSVTAECKRAEGIVHGRKITVIDTPGFFDTNLDDSEIKSEIAKALTECAPGIDAFVLVLKVGKYTKHETEVIQQLLNTLDENVLKHTVILFTFGDQLEDQTLEEFMKDNKQLKELVGKCENHCHVIDNKYWNNCHSGDKSNSVQVKSLLDTIDDMVKKNGCYTNELFRKDDTAEIYKNKGFKKQGIIKTFWNMVIQFSRGKKLPYLVGFLGLVIASQIFKSHINHK